MPWLLQEQEHMLYPQMHSGIHSSRICADKETEWMVGGMALDIHSLSIIVLSNKTEGLAL